MSFMLYSLCLPTNLILVQYLLWFTVHTYMVLTTCNRTWIIFCSTRCVIDGQCVCACVRESQIQAHSDLRPPQTGFRAWNKFRLMFIYKHTPCRTGLMDLCHPISLPPTSTSAQSDFLPPLVSLHTLDFLLPKAVQPFTKCATRTGIDWYDPLLRYAVLHIHSSLCIYSST